MDTIRFAVVGLGMGHNRATLIHNTPGAKLVTVCDLDENRCRRTAAALGCEWTTDYEAVLKRTDVDVVMIMTPSGTHAELGCMAAAAGKHVITTKPIDVTVENADRLIAACHRAGVRLAVDFESRYVPDVVKVKQAIDQGLFGKVILAEATLKWFRPQSYYDVGWRGTWRLDGGGSLMNQTVHDIDVLLWYLGPIEWVQGFAGVFTHQIETEDLGMAMFQSVNGAVGRVLGTTTYPLQQPTRKEVHGEHLGVVLLDNRIESWHPRADFSVPVLDEPTGPRNVIEDMVQALTQGTPLRVTGEEGRRTVEFVTAVYRAAREGGRVTLESSAAA